MPHAPTTARRARLGLLALALISACALPAHGAQAKKPRTKQRASLTVNVTVTDQSGAFIQSGEVIIRRTGGTDKKAKIDKGVARITGLFVSEPDYQVLVAAENYKQPEPPPAIPLDLLEAAAKGDKIVTLPQPVVMLAQAAPEQSTEQSRLQAQLSTLIPKHPELLDAALQQVDAHAELQNRVRDQVAKGQHPWVAAIAAKRRSLWGYLWFLALPVTFLAGLLAERVLRGPHGEPAGDAGRRLDPVAGDPPAHPAAPGPAGQEAAAAGAADVSLAAKVDRLVQQQEVLAGLLGKLFERQTPGADGGGSGAPTTGVAAAPDPADVASRVVRTGEAAAADAPRQFGDVNEYAQSYYRSLTRDGRSSPTPKYLDAEVRSSPKDLVGDRQVFLQEVTHMQGAFVLFADEHGKGWVFPNPQLNFSPALRPVFPQLTASDYNSSRETIEPVPAVQVGDERWKVERKS